MKNKVLDERLARLLTAIENFCKPEDKEDIVSYFKNNQVEIIQECNLARVYVGLATCFEKKRGPVSKETVFCEIESKRRSKSVDNGFYSNDCPFNDEYDHNGCLSRGRFFRGSPPQ